MHVHFRSLLPMLSSSKGHRLGRHASDLADGLRGLRHLPHPEVPLRSTGATRTWRGRCHRACGAGAVSFGEDCTTPVSKATKPNTIGI